MYLYSYDPSNLEEIKEMYDILMLISSLQGNVNREKPKLYIKFIKSHFGKPINMDDYWLEKMMEPGEWLEEYEIVKVKGWMELIEIFKDEIKGAVIWDPEVNATSNVAATIAGVEDLVVVRYDNSPGSVYDKVINKGPKLEVKKNLKDCSKG